MDETFLNRCRACTKLQDDTQKMVSLFVRNTSEMFINCTSLEITWHDSLPSHICFECFKKLSKFNDFRQNCLNSDTYFREQLITEPIKVEPLVDEIIVKCEESETSRLFESKFVNEDFTKYDPELIVLPSSSTYVCDPIDHLNPLDYTKYTCDYCGKSFDRKENLGAHMTKHKNEMSLEPRPRHIKCTAEGCGKVFASKKNLNEHRLRVHKVKLERRVRETKVVDKKLKYCCTQCPKWFLVEHKLGAHVRSKHEGLKQYQCSQCDKEFTKHRIYIDHIRFMHSTVDNERYKCTYAGCDKEYDVKSTLVSHIKRIHLGIVSATVRNRQFICDQCGQSFTTGFMLKTHKYTHSGISPFACKICPKAFKTKYKLKIHTMRHNKVKPFQCPTCGLRKTTNKELRHHINNIHSKEISYPCKECPRVFTSYDGMNQHVRLHHRNHKPYICPHCEWTFARADTMKNHIMTHTGEKPFTCSVCERKFIQAVALRAHMKVHGKEERS